jgi:hypothetical protein
MDHVIYWTDNSSRGVLPTVVRRCVWSRNLMNEGHNPRWAAVPKEKKMEHTVVRDLRDCIYLHNYLLKPEMYVKNMRRLTDPGARTV